VERAIVLWTHYLTVNPEEIEEPWDGEIRQIRLSLRITSQCMNVYPSIENATTSLFNQLFAFHGIVSKQPRIVANRHQATLRTEEDPTYKSAILNMPSQTKVMFDAYRAITSVMSRVSTYVNEWIRYQVLWDLQSDFVGDRLENDLDKWIRTLVEIRDTRKKLDDSNSIGMRAFPVFIDYAEVQNKVAAKYDFWQREIQQRFVGVLGAFIIYYIVLVYSNLGESIKNFYEEISKFRPELENQSLDSSSTSDAIALITTVQNLKKRFDLYESQVLQFNGGERLLTSARHPLPNSWIYAEHVASEWSALTQLLERKNAVIKSRVS
jgi:dynein heavy chain 1